VAADPFTGRMKMLSSATRIEIRVTMLNPSSTNYLNRKELATH
jgi:hypothetical protein